MTVKSCQNFCKANNYGFAGVEFGYECYRVNELQPGSTVGNTGCNMPCLGNQYDTCGGPLRLNLYQVTTFTVPVTPPAVDNYVS
jgi:hypothetical protein